MSSTSCSSRSRSPIDTRLLRLSGETCLGISEIHDDITSQKKIHIPRSKSSKMVRVKEVIQCNQCPFKTPYNSHLNAHMHRHATCKLPCMFCNMPFSGKSHLKRHCRTFHNSEDSGYDLEPETIFIRCDKCEYGTFRKGDMKKHAFRHQNGLVKTRLSDKFSNKQKHRQSVITNYPNIEDQLQPCDNGSNKAHNKAPEKEKIPHGRKDNAHNIECVFCDFVANSYMSLIEHLDSHTFDDTVSNSEEIFVATQLDKGNEDSDGKEHYADEIFVDATLDDTNFNELDDDVEVLEPGMEDLDIDEGDSFEWKGDSDVSGSNISNESDKVVSDVPGGSTESNGSKDSSDIHTDDEIKDKLNTRFVLENYDGDVYLNTSGEETHSNTDGDEHEMMDVEDERIRRQVENNDNKSCSYHTSIQCGVTKVTVQASRKDFTERDSQLVKDHEGDKKRKTHEHHRTNEWKLKLKKRVDRTRDNGVALGDDDSEKPMDIVLFTCRSCEYRTGDVRALEEHIKRHNEAPGREKSKDTPTSNDRRSKSVGRNSGERFTERSSGKQNGKRSYTGHGTSRQSERISRENYRRDRSRDGEAFGRGRNHHEYRREMGRRSNSRNGTRKHDKERERFSTGQVNGVNERARKQDKETEHSNSRTHRRSEDRGNRPGRKHQNRERFGEVLTGRMSKADFKKTGRFYAELPIGNHGDDVVYECLICDTDNFFETIKLAERHFKKHHLKLRRKICESCEYCCKPFPCAR